MQGGVTRAWRMRQHIHMKGITVYIHGSHLTGPLFPLSIYPSISNTPLSSQYPSILIWHLPRPSYLQFWLHLASPRSSTSTSHQNLLINLLIHPSLRSWHLYLYLSGRCSINQKQFLYPGSTPNWSLVKPRKQSRRWSTITQACP